MSETLSPLPTVRVHGLAFVDATLECLTEHLAHRLTQAIPTAVFTPNALIGARALEDVELHRLLMQADLLLPDGEGVLAASRRQTPHAPLTHRLAGIEAGERVVRLCAQRGYSVYFLGGEQGVAAAAAAAWQKKLPTLRVAGHHNGYFEKWGEESERLCRDIAACAPDVMLVCFGFPMQERWITENRERLPSVRLWMGLGGSLDVWAGHIRRAPRLFRRLRLEWLWRAMCQPRRLFDLPCLFRYVLTPCCGENQLFSPSASAENSQNPQN